MRRARPFPSPPSRNVLPRSDDTPASSPAATGGGGGGAQDFAVEVDKQAEDVDEVADNVEKAHAKMQSGVAEIRRAADHQQMGTCAVS